MMPSAADCRALREQLSAFVDGELPASQRISVERHLASCATCSGRVADLRAGSGLLRIGLELRADEVDWRDFTKGVMARIAPAPVLFAERWRVSLRELFTYRRGTLATALAAGVAIIALAPVLLRSPAPNGYARQTMAVQSVSTNPDAHVAPVVMAGEHGNAIIWLVSHKHVLEGKAPYEQSDGVDNETGRPLKVDQERKKEGEL